MRASYVAMQVIARHALVPLAIASLLTGRPQSLGTSWGLWRHYWVPVTLAITTVSTGVLIGQLSTLDARAAAAAARHQHVGSMLPDASPVLPATAAWVLLMLALVLSIRRPAV